MRNYYVYIMSNRSKTIYVGVTNNLYRRVHEHKIGVKEGFTKKYKLDRLIHFEETNSIHDAITREKQIKGWLRSKKIELIESTNPEWKDLSEEWLVETKADPSLRSG